jgi:NADH:ubiquinone oxidoreductase subunit H
MLISILEIIIIIIPILGSIAYLTLAERKVMGYSINKKPLNKLYEKKS